MKANQGSHKKLKESTKKSSSGCKRIIVWVVIGILVLTAVGVIQSVRIIINPDYATSVALTSVARNAERTVTAIAKATTTAQAKEIAAVTKEARNAERTVTAIAKATTLPPTPTSPPPIPTSALDTITDILARGLQVENYGSFAPDWRVDYVNGQNCAYFNFSLTTREGSYSRFDDSDLQRAGAQIQLEILRDGQVIDTIGPTSLKEARAIAGGIFLAYYGRECIPPALPTTESYNGLEFHLTVSVDNITIVDFRAIRQDKYEWQEIE